MKLAADHRSQVLTALGQSVLQNKRVAGTMGAGGDASGVAPQELDRKASKLSKVKEDLTVLKSLWFNKASAQKNAILLYILLHYLQLLNPVPSQVKGSDHAARLESFYGPQAHACRLSPLRYCRHRLHPPLRAEYGQLELRGTLCLQTTSSGQIFCGVANPCSQPVQHDSLRKGI